MKLKMKREGSYRLHLNQAELEALFEYINHTEVDVNQTDDVIEQFLLHELNRFGWDLYHLAIPHMQ